MPKTDKQKLLVQKINSVYICNSNLLSHDKINLLVRFFGFFCYNDMVIGLSSTMVLGYVTICWNFPCKSTGCHLKKQYEFIDRRNNGL